MELDLLVSLAEGEIGEIHLDELGLCKQLLQSWRKSGGVIGLWSQCLNGTSCTEDAAALQKVILQSLLNLALRLLPSVRATSTINWHSEITRSLERSSRIPLESSNPALIYARRLTYAYSILRLVVMMGVSMPSIETDVLSIHTDSAACSIETQSGHLSSTGHSLAKAIASGSGYASFLLEASQPPINQRWLEKELVGVDSDYDEQKEELSEPAYVSATKLASYLATATHQINVAIFLVLNFANPQELAKCTLLPEVLCLNESVHDIELPVITLVPSSFYGLYSKVAGDTHDNGRDVVESAQVHIDTRRNPEGLQASIRQAHSLGLEYESNTILENSAFETSYFHSLSNWANIPLLTLCVSPGFSTVLLAFAQIRTFEEANQGVSPNQISLEDSSLVGSIFSLRGNGGDASLLLGTQSGDGCKAYVQDSEALYDMILGLGVNRGSANRNHHHLFLTSISLEFVQRILEQSISHELRSQKQEVECSQLFQHFLSICKKPKSEAKLLLNYNEGGFLGAPLYSPYFALTKLSDRLSKCIETTHIDNVVLTGPQLQLEKGKSVQRENSSKVKYVRNEDKEYLMLHIATQASFLLARAKAESDKSIFNSLEISKCCKVVAKLFDDQELPKPIVKVQINNYDKDIQIRCIGQHLGLSKAGLLMELLVVISRFLKILDHSMDKESSSTESDLAEFLVRIFKKSLRRATEIGSPPSTDIIAEFMIRLILITLTRPEASLSSKVVKHLGLSTKEDYSEGDESVRLEWITSLSSLIVAQPTQFTPNATMRDRSTFRHLLDSPIIILHSNQPYRPLALRSAACSFVAHLTRLASASFVNYYQDRVILPSILEPAPEPNEGILTIVMVFQSTKFVQSILNLLSHPSSEGDINKGQALFVRHSDSEKCNLPISSASFAQLARESCSLMGISYADYMSRIHSHYLYDELMASLWKLTSLSISCTGGLLSIYLMSELRQTLNDHSQNQDSNESYLSLFPLLQITSEKNPLAEVLQSLPSIGTWVSSRPLLFPKEKYDVTHKFTGRSLSSAIVAARTITTVSRMIIDATKLKNSSIELAESQPFNSIFNEACRESARTSLNRAVAGLTVVSEDKRTLPILISVFTANNNTQEQVSSIHKAWSLDASEAIETIFSFCESEYPLSHVKLNSQIAPEEYEAIFSLDTRLKPSQYLSRSAHHFKAPADPHIPRSMAKSFTEFTQESVRQSSVTRGVKVDYLSLTAPIAANQVSKMPLPSHHAVASDIHNGKSTQTVEVNSKPDLNIQDLDDTVICEDSQSGFQDNGIEKDKTIPLHLSKGRDARSNNNTSGLRHNDFQNSVSMPILSCFKQMQNNLQSTEKSMGNNRLASQILFIIDSMQMPEISSSANAEEAVSSSLTTITNREITNSSTASSMVELLLKDAEHSHALQLAQQKTNIAEAKWKRVKIALEALEAESSSLASRHEAARHQLVIVSQERADELKRSAETLAVAHAQDQAISEEARKAAESKVAAADAQIEKLVTEQIQVYESLKETQDEANQLRLFIEESNREKELMSLNIQKLNDQLEIDSKKQEDLQHSLASLHKQVEITNKDKTEVELKFIAMNEENMKLQHAILSLEDSNETCKTTLLEKEDRIRDLQQEIILLKAQLAEAEFKSKNEKNISDDLKSQVAVSRSEIEAKSMEIAKVAQELEVSKKSWDGEREKSSRQMRSCMSELVATKFEFKSYREQSTQRKKDYESEVAKLQRALKAMEEKHNAREQEITGRIMSLETETHMLKSESIESKLQNENLKIQTLELKSKLNELEQEKKLLMQENEKLEEKNKVQEHQHTDLQKNLEARAKLLTDEKLDLIASLESCKSERAFYMSKVEKVSKDMQDCADAYEAVNTQLEKIQIHVSFWKRKYLHQKSKLKEKQRTLQQAIQLMTGQAGGVTHETNSDYDDDDDDEEIESELELLSTSSRVLSKKPVGPSNAYFGLEKNDSHAEEKSSISQRGFSQKIRTGGMTNNTLSESVNETPVMASSQSTTLRIHSNQPSTLHLKKATNVKPTKTWK